MLVAMTSPAYSPARRPKAQAREARSDPAEQHGGKRDRDAGGPVMDAEDLERHGHHPVFEWRFFEVGDAVQPGGHPVARLQHVAGDLALDGIHVVHERRRADDAAGRKSGRQPGLR